MYMHSIIIKIKPQQAWDAWFNHGDLVHAVVSHARLLYNRKQKNSLVT